MFEKLMETVTIVKVGVMLIVVAWVFTRWLHAPA
jgi:hypothetical protein